MPSEPAPSGPPQSAPVPSGGAQSSVVPSSPSTRFAAATTATGFVAFSSSSASQPASSAALNTLPSSTLPTSTAQTGRSDTLTPVVSVVSSSTFTVSQPTTGASESTFPSIAGGSDSSRSGSGSASTSDSNSSTSNHGLSPGAIAGIVIGVLVGIAAIIALILFCIKRRKKRQEEQGEKSDARDGNLAGSERPLSALAAKWAAFRASVAAKAGLRPTSTDGLARRGPESPAFEPVSRSSYSSAGSAGSAGSTRHLRSASAPAKPPNRFAAFRQKFKKQQDIIPERRSRAVSTDSIPSFYSPTPPQLEDLPESLNPFRDPVPLSYHITNPDAPNLSPQIRTPKSVMLLGDGINDQQRAPLTPGSAKWRQPTPEFDFPASNQAENPFLDPVKRASTGSVPDARRNSLSFPPMARVASHARTQSSGTNAMSHARSSWYSEDSGYNSPHHPSANIPPLRPGKNNPFEDKYATETMPQQQETDSASIYILPSSRQASVDSGKGPVGPIPLPSANNLMAMAMKTPDLPTTSTFRSSWLSPQDSPSSYYNVSSRNSRFSGRESKRRTAASRATRGKSDPFDLDRPEVLAVASNYDPYESPPKTRTSNGSDWWKGIVDEGTGTTNGYDSPSKRRTAAFAYGLAR